MRQPSVVEESDLVPPAFHALLRSARRGGGEGTGNLPADLFICVCADGFRSRGVGLNGNDMSRSDGCGVASGREGIGERESVT